MDCIIQIERDTFALNSNQIMSFWKNLWSNKLDVTPDVLFGRSYNGILSPQQTQAWNQATNYFNQGEFKRSIQSLFEYLNTAHQNNIIAIQNSNMLEYELVQGSKVIKILVDQLQFYAEVKIAVCKELHVGFMRKALETNFDLQYARYTLDEEQHLCLVFDSHLEEASPYKIFNGLKEMALLADEQDDILINAFEQLVPININHIIDIDEAQKSIKWTFFNQVIDIITAEGVLGTLNRDRFPGALVYIYLDAIYKLDYLIKPESKVAEIINQAHLNYFDKPDENALSKVYALESKILEFKDISKDDFYKELYHVTHTFEMNSSVPFASICQIFDTELQGILWYEENKHDFVIFAICGYLIGFCLYNYALPQPVAELSHLYYRIVEPKYFSDLGFMTPYNKTDDIAKWEYQIKSEVKAILKQNQSRYPQMNLDVKLDFSSRLKFFISYITLIRNLNL